MYKGVVSLLLLCFLSCANGFIVRDPGRILFKNFATTKSKVGSLGDRETNSQEKIPKRLNGKKTPKSDNSKANSKLPSASETDESQDELLDAEALLKNLRELLPGETFCLRKITEWLAANGTPRSDYEYFDDRLSWALYPSGIHLTLNKDLKLSIQTGTTAGNAFCETALVTKHGLLNDSSLGYGEEVRRWDEPEDLFQHIVEIRQKLKDKQANQKPDNTEVPLQE